MKTLKVLAIGNSFSEDATAYLHAFAAAAGYDVQVVNLYIGGCPLERHWQNIENDGKYSYQRNGNLSHRQFSIRDALALDSWDIIVTQQASHDSGWECTYEPFLGLITDYLRTQKPNAKLYLQETWAYDPSSTHGNFMRYSRNQQLMYEKLHACYSKMAAKYDYSLIPSGTVIQKLRALPEFCLASGGISLCRDGFHMSFDYGRYALACVWLRTLLGISLTDVDYVPVSDNFDGVPSSELLRLIRSSVDAWIQR